MLWVPGHPNKLALPRSTGVRGDSARVATSATVPSVEDVAEDAVQEAPVVVPVPVVAAAPTAVSVAMVPALTRRAAVTAARSEERRVGTEFRTRRAITTRCTTYTSVLSR